ncbi:hypothetical protein [Cutibacterium granulosum]|uniref:hypothetical protein n=1 Tax=Cutibacterium granulosum TaxID=33011 RepID=UPI0023FA4107|nr:hypothetical protein [Cutibacterium granulosum]
MSKKNRGKTSRPQGQKTNPDTVRQQQEGHSRPGSPRQKHGRGTAAPNHAGDSRAARRENPTSPGRRRHGPVVNGLRALRSRELKPWSRRERTSGSAMPAKGKEWDHILADLRRRAEGSAVTADPSAPKSSTHRSDAGDAPHR